MEQFDWTLTVKRNMRMLKLVGLWPKTDKNYPLNVYTVYAMISMTVFIFGHNFFQTVNIYFIIDDINAVTATIFVALTDMAAILKSYAVIQNMNTLKHLLRTLNCEMFQPKNEKQRALAQVTLENWTKVYKIYFTLAFSTIFFWAVFPILDGTAKEYRLPFLAWYPYNYKRFPQYEITYIYQIASVLFIATCNLHVDTLISALLMYVGMQCDLLCDNLRNLDDVGGEVSDDAVKIKFIECVKHHRAIMDFASDTNTFLDMTVFGQFFISAISIGLTMYQLTVVAPFTSEFFSFVLYGVAITVETLMYCWFGNEVEIKSGNIPEAVYAFDWTDRSIEIKKNIVFFIVKTQTPIKISAMKLFYLSLDTFMRIMRAAWSYFALLR